MNCERKREKQKNLFVFLLLVLMFNLSVSSQSYKDYFKDGKEKMKQFDYLGAIQSLNQAVNLDTQNKETYILLGDAYKELRRFKESAENYEKAYLLIKSSGNFNALSLRKQVADMYYEAKEYEKAQVHYMALARVKIENKSLRVQIIRCAFYSGSFLETFEFCEKFLDGSYQTRAESDTVTYYAGMASFELSKKSSGDERVRYLRRSASAFRYILSSNNYDIGKRRDIKVSENLLPIIRMMIGLSVDPELDYKTAIIYQSYFVQSQPSISDHLFDRAVLFQASNQPDSAFKDINAALEMSVNNKKYLFFRGNLKMKQGLYAEAIKDFDQVNLVYPNDTNAYILNGKCNLLINEFGHAKGKFSQALDLYEGNNEVLIDLIRECDSLEFEYYREEHKPIIQVLNSDQEDKFKFTIDASSKLLFIEGVVNDQSLIRSIIVENSAANFDKNSKNPAFKASVPISAKDFVFIRAVDIYDNVGEYTLALLRRKPSNIGIRLTFPENFVDVSISEVYPERADQTQWMIEGVLDYSEDALSLLVNNQALKYQLKNDKLAFSGLINVATDEDSLSFDFILQEGVQLQKKYFINRQERTSVDMTMMGRTWVVFIQNAEYIYKASLSGPIEDLSIIKRAFRDYNIQLFIEKKNLTYSEMDQYFRYELKDQVKKAHVKSLVIWYAGHGSHVENDDGSVAQSFWISVDASRNYNPRSPNGYYSLNDLSHYLNDYNLNHLLVISDACQTGASFEDKERGDVRLFSCDSSVSMLPRSYQALTSANEGAADNSILAKTFSDVLASYKNKRCVPINTILRKVQQRSEIRNQKAELNYLKDFISDKNGSFYFIAK